MAPCQPKGVAPLPSLPPADMAGPFPWTNWVIGRQVLMGAFPATLDDQETTEILQTMLELGIGTFVCLQAEFRLDRPEREWRNGFGLRPYIKDATTLLGSSAARENKRIKQKKLDFLHLPIIDGSVTTDLAMERLEEDVRARILNGEGVYIHCWGGHGRTGTLVALLLASIYGLSTKDALTYTQALHDCRLSPQGVRSPQTRVQREQVHRIISGRSQQKAQISTDISSVSNDVSRRGTSLTPEAESRLDLSGTQTARLLLSAALKGGNALPEALSNSGIVRPAEGESCRPSSATSKRQPLFLNIKEKHTPVTYRRRQPAACLEEPRPRDAFSSSDAATTWLSQKLKGGAGDLAWTDSRPGSGTLIKAARIPASQNDTVAASSREGSAESQSGAVTGPRPLSSNGGESAEGAVRTLTGEPAQAALHKDRSLPALMKYCRQALSTRGALKGGLLLRPVDRPATACDDCGVHASSLRKPPSGTLLSAKTSYTGSSRTFTAYKPDEQQMDNASSSEESIDLLQIRPGTAPVQSMRPHSPVTGMLPAQKLQSQTACLSPPGNSIQLPASISRSLGSRNWTSKMPKVQRKPSFSMPSNLGVPFPSGIAVIGSPCKQELAA